MWQAHWLAVFLPLSEAVGERTFSLKQGSAHMNAWLLWRLILSCLRWYLYTIQEMVLKLLVLLKCALSWFLALTRKQHDILNLIKCFNLKQRTLNCRELHNFTRWSNATEVDRFYWVSAEDWQRQSTVVKCQCGFDTLWWGASIKKKAALLGSLVLLS